MSEQRRVFDAGLQPERTALAWRRTCLSLLIGSVVGARVLAERWGWVALALGAAGVFASVCLWVVSGRRARTTAALLLRDGDLAGGRGGGLHLALAACCAAAGCTGLLLVLAGR